MGYDWLTCHNPCIDWVEMKIMFHSLEPRKTLVEMTTPAPRAVDIQLVSKQTMGKICQEAGSTTFLLSPSAAQLACSPCWNNLDQLEARAALTAQLEDPLIGIPWEYHDFKDVFSGEKANTLAPH